MKGSPWGLEDPGRVTAINAGAPDLRIGGVNRTEESCGSCAIPGALTVGDPTPGCALISGAHMGHLHDLRSVCLSLAPFNTPQVTAGLQ